MNEINFIPEQYRRRQRRRRRLARQGCLIAIALVCMGGWAIFQHRQTGQLRQYARTLEQQVEAERGRLEQLQRLSQRHDTLKRQVKLQQRIAQPLSHTRILTALARVLPDAVALTHLRMDTRRPETDMSQAPEGSMLAIASRAAPSGIAMEFEALAADDLTVANLVAKLSEHPVFSNVSMRRSRTVTHRGKPLRDFRLELRVNLQRRFELTRQQEGGVADAAG